MPQLLTLLCSLQLLPCVRKLRLQPCCLLITLYQLCCLVSNLLLKQHHTAFRDAFAVLQQLLLHIRG